MRGLLDTTCVTSNLHTLLRVCTVDFFLGSVAAAPLARWRREKGCSLAACGEHGSPWCCFWSWGCRSGRHCNQCCHLLWPCTPDVAAERPLGRTSLESHVSISTHVCWVLVREPFHEPFREPFLVSVGCCALPRFVRSVPALSSCRNQAFAVSCSSSSPLPASTAAPASPFATTAGSWRASS